MSIDAALVTDDPALLDEAIADWVDVDQLINTSDAHDVSLLWVAAALEKPRLTKYLLDRGASPLFARDGFPVLALIASRKNAELMRAALKGGVEPDALFYSAWVAAGDLEAEEMAPPRALASAEAARVLGFEKIANPSKAAKLIKKMAAFRCAYEPLFVQLRAIESAERLLSVASNKLNSKREKSWQVQELEQQIEIAAMSHGLAVALALTFYADNPDAVPTSVRRNFAAVQNSRKAWQIAFGRCVDDIAQLCAPRLGGYTDDVIPQMVAEFLISTFPIRSYVHGQLARAAAPLKDQTGRQFELACAATLESAGYLVEATPVTGDQGADLLATRSGIKYAVQCKDVAGSVGNAAVQEVVASKDYYGTDYGVVCATGKYTDSARRLAAKNHIILCSFDLLPMIDRLAGMIE